MSLKLCCALRISLKSARLSLFNSEKLIMCQNLVKCKKLANFTIQSRWVSTKNVQNQIDDFENRKKVFKPIYRGLLAAHVKAVKIFSVSTSAVGVCVQPILYQEIVATGNVPIIFAAYTFIGFFTVVTPLLLHFLTRKYVIEMSYNDETDKYKAKTLNLLGMSKETEFKVEDVVIPDLPGMFVTFRVHGKPLFVDPRGFDIPEHYGKIMGYDKPIDFKLYNDGKESVAANSNNNSSQK